MRTPLTKPSSQPRVRAPWHRRRLFPLMMLGFGLAVTGAVYLLLTTLAYRAMKAEFTAAARDHVEAIRREVEGSLQALHSVGALFDASETVTRAEFDAFVRSTLTDLGQIDAVAWVPRVSADQRDAFETRARHEGITRFRIVEHHHTDQGPPAPAPRDRSVFYPVSYIAPATRNEPILGLDLAAHATCRAALQRACRSGKVDGTGPIRLARKHADAITGLFLLPLWPQEGLHPPPCPDVRGFIVAFLTPDRLAERALASLGSRRMNVRLYDIRADGTTDLLHASVRPGSTAAGGHPSAADPALSHAGIVNVAGRAWQVRCDAPKAYLGAYAPRYPLIILIIG